jgi:hypothetical protein
MRSRAMRRLCKSVNASSPDWTVLTYTTSAFSYARKLKDKHLSNYSSEHGTYRSILFYVMLGYCGQISCGRAPDGCIAPAKVRSAGTRQPSHLCRTDSTVIATMQGLTNAELMALQQHIARYLRMSLPSARFGTTMQRTAYAMFRVETYQCLRMHF